MLPQVAGTICTDRSQDVNPSSSRAGLNDVEVIEARRKHGWNELPVAAGPRPLTVLLRQFTSFLVIILIGAAGVALLLGEWIDAATIGLVIGLNAALGFIQEWRAETALTSLRKMLSPQAVVIRNAKERLIPAREIVPGDVIVLTPGSRVAADGDVIRQSELAVDESVLTGESVAVTKEAGGEAGRVFAGTSVTTGRAEALVTATGINTEFGRIADLTGSVGEKTTNLQVKLGQLAKQLGLTALLLAATVASLGVVLGRDPVEMVMMGLSLSVAIVPEGLPAVVTITLALGATAMVRQNALARRLQAVETLGAASVICTDKTGTLTENKMTAVSIWTFDRRYEVTGTGYDPTGHIEADGERLRASDDPVLAAVLNCGLYCNHASLVRQGSDWQMIGEPTEGALVTLAYKGWCDLPQHREPMAEMPFSSARKRMSVLYRFPEGTFILAKGAPEQILDISSHYLTPDGRARPLSDDAREGVVEAYEELARKGLRVIALARRETPDEHIVEADLTFLGLVGLIDPPRAEVRDAIASASGAGIRTIMVTGDSPITAKAIAEQLNLGAVGHITGTELEALDDASLSERLREPTLFARTKPEQKMRIVEALQAQGLIVAMTGDGVNDAPALKRADIGVSMGIRGTDVSRDASDLVLLDDNFATIVHAIGEGRRQFANVQKFVHYLLSSNAGEVVALVVNIAIGGPLIFLATQILWMNLVTDSLTAVALGLEKAEPDQMQHPPRRKDSPILGRGSLVAICCLGLYTGLSSLWIFLHLMDQGVELARTTAFTAMVVFEKMSVFAFRSLRLPCWRIGWFSNPLLFAALVVSLGAQVAAVYWPPLQVMLHTVGIGLDQWLMIAAFALPIIILPEALKTLRVLPRGLAEEAA